MQAGRGWGKPNLCMFFLSWTRMGGLGSEAQVGGLQQATTTKCCKGSGVQEGRVQHGYKKQEWDTGASQEGPCPE